MDVETLIAEFRRELPWHLRCSEKVAETSAYDVRQFLRSQTASFPECFTYQAVVVHLDWLKNSPPRRRDKKKRAASTVNGHLKSLKRFAKWALARSYIESDPIAHLKGLTEDDRIMVPPSVEDMAKLFNVAKCFGSSPETQARNFALICLLIDTGPRAKELAQMDLAEVMDGRRIAKHAVVHGKGAKDRIIPLGRLTRISLWVYLRRRRPKRGETALWLTEDGTRMTYEALRGVVQRMTAKAKMKASLHDFRRYCYTHLWLAGIDIISGMKLAGHTRTDVFLRYIRPAVAIRAMQEHEPRSPLKAIISLKDLIEGEGDSIQVGMEP